jgi:tetratricopeptide (TPR) repeat protein
VGLSTSPSGKTERPIKAEAHDAYLLGRYHWFAFETDKAEEQFQKAIDLQPDYAAAWSGLADSLTLKAVDDEIDPAAVMPQAEKAARKGLALDDSLAEAHNAMAAVYFFYKWDWNAAERESARAVELTPSLAEPHHLREKILNALSRHEEAVQEQRKAMELDPFARSWAMAFALIEAHQYDAALEDARIRVSVQPSNPSLHWILSVAYRAKGMEKEAVQEWAKAVELGGNADWAAGLRRAYAKRGYRGAGEWNLEGIRKRAKGEYVAPFDFAQAYAMLGERNETLRYLEMSYKQRGASMAELTCKPDFEFLHSDPGYRAIVAKMGLPAAN